MAENQIPIASHLGGMVICHCFFACQRLSTIHWLSLLLRLIFSPNHHSRRFGPQPELLELGNLHFQTPHSLINPSLKVHFECKLEYDFVLSSLCVVLLSAPCLMYDSVTMCCISWRNEFFFDRENPMRLPVTKYLDSHEYYRDTSHAPAIQEHMHYSST